MEPQTLVQMREALTAAGPRAEESAPGLAVCSQPGWASGPRVPGGRG